MSWQELANLGVRVRPLQEPRPPVGGSRSPFTASFSSTVATLATEFRALDARNVVLELDVRERDLRADGLLRANARMPAHPAVAVAFESRFGPLRYATAEYKTQSCWEVRDQPVWQANLRAIALSMEALRAVDRYGVSKRGEQYVGWKQLPRSTDPADAIVTEEQAWAVLVQAAGISSDSSPLLNGISTQDAVRRALLATHPDRGGDETEFRKVMRAKEILGA